MFTRISINPQIHFGKPFITGTRIKVQDVMELVNARISFSDIVKDYYPDITEDDVRACMDCSTDL